MRLEKVPDDVGRVQAVTRLADQFLGQSIDAAGPDVAESPDPVVLDLAALGALIVRDLQHAIAARRLHLRSAAEHPLPFLERIFDRRDVLSFPPWQLHVAAVDWVERVLRADDEEQRNGICESLFRVPEMAGDGGDRSDSICEIEADAEGHRRAVGETGA